MQAHVVKRLRCAELFRVRA